MSTLNRFRRLIKGYLDREFDRITSIERAVAENELNNALGYTSDFTASNSREPIRESSEVKPKKSEMSSEVLWAYQTLGLAENSSFALVRSTYYKISNRVDPQRFESNSQEAIKADEIKKRVDKAYDILRKQLDTGAQRFDQLEIE